MLAGANFCERIQGFAEHIHRLCDDAQAMIGKTLSFSAWRSSSWRPGIDNPMRI
jgi:hypothetical protein